MLTYLSVSQRSRHPKVEMNEEKIDINVMQVPKKY